MQLFVISKHCTSRQHCGTCRNKIGGRKWRESLSTQFVLPSNEIDFECPMNLPWIESVIKEIPIVLESPKPVKNSGTRGGCGCNRKH